MTATMIEYSMGGGRGSPVRRHRSNRRVRVALRLIPVTLSMSVAGSGVVFAQDAEDDLGFFFTAELSTVWTAGNSSAFTLGASTTFGNVWERSRITFKAGGVRTESGTTNRIAVGTGQDDFVLEKETVRETTAEAYSARVRYDYDLSERFFLYGAADWLRNTFAGIDSRFLLVGGAGNTWSDGERTRFKTTYGASVTFQDDVIENPLISDTFGGLQLGYDFWWHLTTSTDFESVLILDWNLNNTDDIRFDWTNAIPIAISSKLALKPSLRLLWRNDPALTTVDLVDSGGTEIGTVLAPLEKLDSFFTISLVVTL